MPTTAGQLVYTNVEKDRSPHNRGGFQALLHSQSLLSETEVDDIEPRLFYAHSPSNPSKSLFFPLGRDKLVLAHIVPLDDTDTFGRKGSYLAHALVFNQADWITGGLNPIVVLQSFPFCQSIEQALALGDRATSDIAPVSVNHPTTSTPIRQPPTETLQRLTLYALRAEAMVKERQALALIGPPDGVEQILAEVLIAVPAALNAWCSFDSFFYKGNFVSTPCWAVGLPEAPPPGRFIRVDVKQRVFLDDTAPPVPRTFFERWELARLQAHEPGIEDEKETAYTLCRWLEGSLSTTALPEEVPQKILDAVSRIVPARAKEQLIARYRPEAQTNNNQSQNAAREKKSSGGFLDGLKRWWLP